MHTKRRSEIRIHMLSYLTAPDGGSFVVCLFNYFSIEQIFAADDDLRALV